MFPCAGFGYGFWWLFPIIMIIMMALCYFMMRGRMGSMMCWPGFRRTGSHGEDASDPALDTLNKRYARGEINKEEYEEKKRVITDHN
jgi:putative membrane protein